MTLNDKYKIYKGTDEKKLEDSKLRYKKFEINGKFNKMGLENLKNQGIKRLFPLLDKEIEEPEETLVYSTPLARIIIFANYKEDHHDIDIYLKASSDNDDKIIEDIKSLLEKRLETKLDDIKSDLINKISEN